MPKRKSKKAAEPVLDEEFVAALKKRGYEVVDHGVHFTVTKIDTRTSTVLEHTDLSGALFEAWNLVKP